MSGSCVEQKQSLVNVRGQRSEEWAEDMDLPPERWQEVRQKDKNRSASKSLVKDDLIKVVCRVFSADVAPCSEALV